MATATPVLDTRYKSKNGTFPIKVRICHADQIPHYVPVNYKIEEKYWAGKSVSPKHPDADIINNAILSVLSEANEYFSDCRKKKRPINVKMVSKGSRGFSFNEFISHKAKQAKEKNKIILFRKFERFVRELKACYGGDVFFTDLNQDTLHELEMYLIKEGNVNNTRHKKFKWYGQLFAAAIKDGKAYPPNPFQHYSIETTPVVKLKLTLEEIKRIENLKLADGPVKTARDIFLFSYYCKGSRFETCVTAKWNQVINDRIFFRMNKGKKYVSVKVHERLQSLLDRYRSDSEFIFPYIKSLPDDAEAYVDLIDSKNTMVNKNLKVVAALAELSIPLTMHIARHSFAQHLKRKTNSIHVIKDALGHSDTKTTEQYLAALDDEALDPEMEKLYGS